MRLTLVYTLLISISLVAQNKDNYWGENEEGNTNIEKSALRFFNTTRVDDLLDKKKRNSSNKIKVFRIQLYSSTNRSGAIKIKTRFKKLYPKTLVETSYEQPYFKTKVGAYLSHLDAKKKLKDYKKNFNDAFIFEEFITIEKF